MVLFFEQKQSINRIDDALHIGDRKLFQRVSAEPGGEVRLDRDGAFHPDF